MNKTKTIRCIAALILAAFILSNLAVTSGSTDQELDAEPSDEEMPSDPTENPENPADTPDGITIGNPPSEAPNVTPTRGTFKVTTDYGYKCTTGDPSEAIQNAINSLPPQRTQPCNIYLRGVFCPVSNIVMADNVRFVGKNATLLTQENTPMFIHPWSDYNTKIYGSLFEIEGNLYQDWVTLQNVTFQNIRFKQLVTYTGQNDSAIYFYDGNSTGWGRSNNLNVYNCSFNGFYNCIQGIAMNSSFLGNRFYNYSNNAIMFPLGANLTIQNNVFHTPANPHTVKQYQKMYGKSSIQGGIGLFLMDVNGWATISNNTFRQGKNSTGLTFSSCPGNFLVTENVFSGPGKAYSMDVFPRPWKSSGVVFYNNVGVADFCYNQGVYS